MEKRVGYAIAALAVIVILIGATLIGLTSKKSSMNMGAGQSATPMNDAQAPAQGANAVTIKGYAFGPQTLTVKAGTTVTWTNTDIAKHNIVADEGAPAGGPDGPLFGQGQTYSFTFNTAGTYAYHCDPHPYMHGKVVVTQ